jgi:hypothetical protein
MGHRVPGDPDLRRDSQLFTDSAKYLCETFATCDSTILGYSADGDPYECYHLVWDRFWDYFNRFHRQQQSEKQPAKKPTATKKSSRG